MCLKTTTKYTLTVGLCWVYPLPSHKVQYGLMADSSFAVCSGADGVVISHLLGYGDDVEINSFDNLCKTVR
ncbi:MAG: hypothetical protein M1365_04415 [Actinobacteria bacterium]|nr:hypothetical protein [Actinomycetota bacterium]